MDRAWFASDLLVTGILLGSIIFCGRFAKLFTTTWHRVQSLDIRLFGKFIYFFILFGFCVFAYAVRFFGCLYLSLSHLCLSMQTNESIGECVSEIGCLVNGLFLDGGAWCRKKNHLVEAKNGILFDEMATVSIYTYKYISMYLLFVYSVRYNNGSS